MTRLIRADLLKLRRRTGMLSVVALFVFGSVAAYFGAGLFLDDKGDFETATGILTLIAAVAGAIFGATAGGADIESGVFRDLVATGRSRTALFFSRVPAAWILTLGMLAVAVVASALLSSPSLGEFCRGGASVLVSGALTAAVCVGLAALTGKSGPVMGIVLAFQLGVAPLLAQLDVLGDARWRSPRSRSRASTAPRASSPRCPWLARSGSSSPGPPPDSAADSGEPAPKKSKPPKGTASYAARHAIPILVAILAVGIAVPFSTPWVIAALVPLYVHRASTRSGTGSAARRRSSSRSWSRWTTRSSRSRRSVLRRGVSWPRRATWCCGASARRASASCWPRPPRPRSGCGSRASCTTRSATTCR